ncbi:MAG: hypothetical protein Fur003_4100 [Candidatus Dojkabacteria bacterium]
MAKFCEICGKQTVAGRRIQHHHSIGWRFRAPNKPRQFKANLRQIKVQVDDVKETKITVCMKCYKKLRKEAEAAQAEA